MRPPPPDGSAPSRVPAQCPELTDRQGRPTRVEQERVDGAGGRTGLVEHSIIFDMQNLDQLHARELPTDRPVVRGVDPVGELQRARPGSARMGDDGTGRRFRGQQERRHGGGGTVMAIFPMSSSEIGPGPLGMRPAKPSASAPNPTAIRASSTDEIQQTFTRTRRAAIIAPVWPGLPNRGAGPRRSGGERPRIGVSPIRERVTNR